MTKKPQLIKLMERGYFPKELPPCFTTQALAKSLENKKQLLEKLDEQVKQHKHSYFVPFSIPKWAGFRRRLSIPHPLFATALSKDICENWDRILRASSKSPISKSRIKIGGEKSRRHLFPEHSQKELTNFRIEFAATAKYVLYADISNYYPSVYTHILPWCLHGKKTARRKLTDSALAGNKIDKSLRCLQHDESFGLPIGFDSCFALSEVIGSTIDRILHKQLKSKKITYDGYRYVDDFVLYFNSEENSKIALEQLRLILSELRLTLNEEKTLIKRLPEPIDPTWVFELSKFKFDSQHPITDIKHFFAIAFSAQSINPKDPVLSYALSTLNPSNKSYFELSKLPGEKTLGKFLALVCQAITTRPETLNKAFELLRFYKGRLPLSSNPEWKMLERAINHLIETSSSTDDFELTWSLYFIRFFGFLLTPDAAKIISQSSNSVVVLMALDLINSRKIPSDTFDMGKWKSMVKSKDSANSSHWLLFYECSIKRWLGLNRSNLKKYYWLNLLSQERVEFFKASSLPSKASDAIDSANEIDDMDEIDSMDIPTSTGY